MRDEHIISILESAPLAEIGEGEMATVRAHIDTCRECWRAYEAAQISASLLRARVAEASEPPPFFQTRVLAALRERRASDEASALGRLWKAAGALVSSMAATVAALAVLTVFAPGPQPATRTQQEDRVVASALNSYSAEEVLFDQGEAP
ncbi:MAG TPA: hypothetical protein VE842_10905, partial [Pyrinomonadaceae bacterium]|nr:hypothetical protein [Pyrinomonadaceae bacterium]